MTNFCNCLILKRNLLLWLTAVCFCVAAMVIVGGVTRLTGSGLSMVEWKPLMGAIPPMSDAKWFEIFEKYKQYPHYQKINVGMSLTQFKWIFFWEYLHRFLGRVSGLVALIPFVYFCFQKGLSRQLKIIFGMIPVLMLLQGVLGWYMVKSGLVNNPAVSHFRLASHLSLAFFIFSFCFVMMLQIYFENKNSNSSDFRWHRIAVWAFLVLVILQTVFGTFVAGLKAGFFYNTFPKMGTEWMPDIIWGMKPIWRNFLENPFMIQWIHRLLGILVLLGGIGVFNIFILHEDLTDLQKIGFRWVLGIVFAQVILGILTLVFHVPILLAILHQAGALALLSSCIFLLYVISYS